MPTPRRTSRPSTLRRAPMASPQKGCSRSSARAASVRLSAVHQRSTTPEGPAPAARRRDADVADHLALKCRAALRPDFNEPRARRTCPGGSEPDLARSCRASRGCAQLDVAGDDGGSRRTPSRIDSEDCGSSASAGGCRRVETGAWDVGDAFWSVAAWPGSSPSGSVAHRQAAARPCQLASSGMVGERGQQASRRSR